MVKFVNHDKNTMTISEKEESCTIFVRYIGSNNTTKCSGLVKDTTYEVDEVHFYDSDVTRYSIKGVPGIIAARFFEEV